MHRLPLVLAIEPDLRQAAIVKRIVRERVQADVAVVDSRDAAIEAIRTTMPDVLLVSALLSPRDEDDLIAHLRTLDGAAHLQTHTIPQLASSLGPGDGGSKGGLLSSLWGKKKERALAGCDPDLFADEIRVFLKRAEDKKREAADAHPASVPMPSARDIANPRAESSHAALAEPEPMSSWASPFEWRPSNPPSLIAHPESSIANPESLIANPESLVRNPESAIPDPIVEAAAPVAEKTPTVAVPEPVAAAIQDSGPRIRDTRLKIRDKGLGIRDSALAWARAEESRDGPASDDLHDLLTGLAVPASVAAVSYARGCRIRRVRVRQAAEPDAAASHGAAILSKRIIAELRERGGRSTTLESR